MKQKIPIQNTHRPVARLLNTTPQCHELSPSSPFSANSNVTGISGDPIPARFASPCKRYSGSAEERRMSGRRLVSGKIFSALTGGLEREMRIEKALYRTMLAVGS